MRYGRWTRGRPYNTEGTILLTPTNLTNLSYLNLEAHTIQGGAVLLTPTNLPNLSYLDLDEYSIDCREFLGQQLLSKILIGKRLHELQDVDFSDSCDILTDIFNEITELYKEHVMEHILMEVNLITAVSLLQKWDGEKFRRSETRLRTSKISNEYFMDIYFYVCSRILIEHCSFEKVSNVEFVMTLAVWLCDYKVMKKMPDSHLHFHMMHIAHGLRYHPQADKLKIRVQDLLWIETAFLRGDTCRLRSLLAFGWPTLLLQIWEENFACLKCLRSMGDVEISFMSISFLITFIIRTFEFIRASEAPQLAKTSCIRLLWRAIPTPYVSEDDMDKYIEIFRNLHQSCSASNYFKRLWQTAKGSFFDVYPKDCIADYQPRSLMHLSRCKIRESLDFKQCTVMLLLPNRLIQYLNLEW